MILLSWNVRRLGRPKKRLAMRKIVRKQKENLLILQETKWLEISSILFMRIGAIVAGGETGLCRKGCQVGRFQFGTCL